LSFATGLEDLVCWNIIGESGNVTEQSKPSFATTMRYINSLLTLTLTLNVFHIGGWIAE